MKNNVRAVLLLTILIAASETFAQCPGTHCTTGLYSTGCSAGDFIDKFSFHTIVNNATGCNGGTAAFCTAKTATVVPGTTYTVSMQSGPSQAQGFGVWIDYNMDNDFGDAGEFVYASPTSNTTVNTGTVTIPAAAAGTMRMRVRSNYNTVVTSAQSCNQFTWGETEDYILKANCIQAPAKPSSISGATTVCQGTSQIFTADAPVGATTYSWTVPSGYTITNGQGTNSISLTIGNTAGTLSVTASNSCGTSTVTVKSVSVVAPLSAPAIAGPSEVCSGSSYTYSITTVPSATAYTWTTPTGFVINSGQGTTQLNVTAGITAGNITVTATNVCGTSPAGTKSITVSSTPPVGSGTVSGSTTVCAGNAYTYSSSAVSGATSYSWTGPTGASVISGQGTATVSVLFGTSPGNVTVTPSNGCPGTSTSVSVTVNPSPTANAGSDVSMCPGSSTQLGASGGQSYSWSPATGLNNPNISNPVAMPSGTTGYTVTVSGSNGCTSKDNVTVAIHSLPVANAGADVSFCQGGSVNLNASGGASYQWSPSTGLSASNISDPVASPGSTATYTVSVTSGAGCVAQDEIVVVVNQLPNAGAGNDVSICPGGNTQLTATGGASYSWSPTAGLSDPAIFDPVAMPAGTTTYVVTVTDANGCSATDDITVTVNPLPTANAGSDISVCSGSGTTLAASGNGNFSWSPSAGLSCTNCASPVATVTANTTYTVTVTNSCGTATDDITVSIGSAPSVSAGPDVSVCAGDSAALNAVGSGTFSWAASAGLSCTNCPNPMAGLGVTTTYTVTVTDVCGTGTDEITVNVDPLPAAPAITPNGQMLTSSAGTTYQWYLNSGIISGATNQSYTFTQNGVYSVCITNASGCEACSPGYTVTVTGIENPVSETGLNIFPNPSNGVFTVSLSGEMSGECSIDIINLQGEVVYRNSATIKDRVSIDMAGAPAGIYLMKLNSDKGSLIQKIITY